MSKSQMEDSRPILLIDGFGMFIKAMSANQSTKGNGELIGGVVGFIKSMELCITNHSPKRVYVIWEKGGANTKRKSIYPEYKNSSSKINEIEGAYKGTSVVKIIGDKQTKHKQLLTLIDLLKYLPICQVFIPECECDDVISYLIKSKFVFDKFKKIIVSSDKDFYQLLNDDSVMVFDTTKKIFITEENVKEKFSASIKNACLARTIIGDKSDNISGVKGIAEGKIKKHLPELLTDKEYSVEELINLCKSKILLTENKKYESVYKQIIDEENIIKRNWQLMYLGPFVISAQQATKVNSIVDNFKPKYDQLNFMKKLVEEEISVNFDIQKFSVELRKNLVNNF